MDRRLLGLRWIKIKKTYHFDGKELLNQTRKLEEHFSGTPTLEKIVEFLIL